MQTETTQPLLDFEGRTYESKFDSERLTGQWLRVFNCMKDGEWRTLEEIGNVTGDKSQAAISARLRDFRKVRFHSMTVERRARGERSNGLFEYRVVRP